MNAGPARLAAVELGPELAAALEAGSASIWREALHRSDATDPFTALRVATEEWGLVTAAGANNLDEWLVDANTWVTDDLARRVAPLTTEEDVLRQAWERLRNQIQRALAEARRQGRSRPEEPAPPQEGGVLAFVDGLDLCLVIGFRFVDEMPSLEVVAPIRSPRTVFDVIDSLLQQPHETRNELKRMLQSSHRLIWHRGVLVHVDRYKEPGVFGPSIDTLHVAELIAQRYVLPASARLEAHRVLEVGTGSGFISAGIARHAPGLERLLGIERHTVSAVCTARNVTRNEELTRAGRAAVLVSDFDRSLVPGKFELVVCNPPYVPEADGREADRERQRSGAIAGLGLIDALLEAAPELLADDGRLLLIVSSVTPPDYVRERVPEGLSIEEEPFGTGREGPVRT